MRALQFVPIDADWTAPIVVDGYPAGQLTNRMLERRIAVLEEALTAANISFRLIRCLEGTTPQSPEAKACTDAATAELNAIGAPPP